MPPLLPPPKLLPPELPPLRDIIRRFDLGARKSLGQNFLLDINLTRRIARTAAPLEQANIIEIGPGPGGLTRALLLEGAPHVTAIERDQRCIAALRELEAAFPGRLTIVEGDALEIDAASLTSAPRKIVANLPYNIATPLLIGWLGNIRAYESLTLMFQKEVAERLAAAPGDDAYGRLAVLTQWLCTVKLAFDVPPQAFVPPPKITSTVVHLTPRPTPLAECEQRLLERVTAAAFGQRRKMLRSSLKSLGGDTAALIAAAGVEPTVRAEELSIEQFCALARALDQSRAT
ncbi:MAG TPA: 16S rRNA (adenine(1518)-N(6)/adenine(1519)-N(6))-dimethyltransferase RsmA [Stellaceae bacterium]|nr:16S rRNA (adenine(1518)-N(6)/adenine(1519)-N(6))-dimethyltransferase RsmA [Stellaceae bacterium]